MPPCPPLVCFRCRWVDVLRCCSRWELLQQIASGMPTDAVLFCPDKKEDRIKSAAAAIGKGLKRLGLREADAGNSLASDPRSIDSLSMNESSIRRVHIGGSGRRGDAEDKGIPQVGFSHTKYNRDFADTLRLCMISLLVIP